MRRLALLLSLIFIVSCSNNDNDSQTVLLKQLQVSGLTGQFTYTFNYYGTKLHKITCSDGTRQEYFYSDDVIKLIKHFNAANNLIELYNFEYNSDNKLAIFQTTTFDGATSSVYKQLFNYLPNGTVLVNYSSGTIPDSNSKLIYFNGSEISKEEFLDSSGAIFGNNQYTSDNKNNPMKNVIGYDKIAFAYNFEGSKGLMHNTLSYIFHSNNDPFDIIFNFQADYNESGFPNSIFPADFVTENYDVNWYQFSY